MKQLKITVRIRGMEQSSNSGLFLLVSILILVPFCPCTQSFSSVQSKLHTIQFSSKAKIRLHFNSIFKFKCFFQKLLFLLSIESIFLYFFSKDKTKKKENSKIFILYIWNEYTFFLNFNFQQFSFFYFYSKVISGKCDYSLINYF